MSDETFLSLPASHFIDLAPFNQAASILNLDEGLNVEELTYLSSRLKECDALVQYVLKTKPSKPTGRFVFVKDIEECNKDVDTFTIFKRSIAAEELKLNPAVPKNWQELYFANVRRSAVKQFKNSIVPNMLLHFGAWATLSLTFFLAHKQYIPKNAINVLAIAATAGLLFTVYDNISATKSTVFPNNDVMGHTTVEAFEQAKNGASAVGLSTFLGMVAYFPSPLLYPFHRYMFLGFGLFILASGIYFGYNGYQQALQVKGTSINQV